MNLDRDTAEKAVLVVMAGVLRRSRRRCGDGGGLDGGGLEAVAMEVVGMDLEAVDRGGGKSDGDGDGGD